MGSDGVQMSRYFVSSTQITENRIIIIGEDFQHLKRVLRSAKGDIITVCCDGFDYTAEINEVSSDCISSIIIDKQKNNTETALKVTLFQGLPKMDKMEFIVQKCVELGVNEVVPVLTDRCISKINTSKDAQNKVSRWQKIAVEAAKQCNRGIIPKISMPIKFNEAICLASKMDLSVMPYEKESTLGFKELVKRCSDVANASIFIGPEGGFTVQEVQLAESQGIKKITLGPRILRTETAGMVALSLMMYELGDISNGRN